jgi:hypothetical protein
MKSNAGIDGAFFHSPAPGPFQLFSDTPVGVIASDNDPNIAHDKEFIVADAQAGSIKKNNVYGTWTRFNAKTGAGGGADSPIFFSQSTDGLELELQSSPSSLNSPVAQNMTMLLEVKAQRRSRACTALGPEFRGTREKRFQCNTVGAYEKLALRFE